MIADIIKHEKTHNGIDWEAAAKEGTAAMKEAMKKAHSKLQDIRTKMTNAEVDRAKKMGLLDSKGKGSNPNTTGSILRGGTLVC